MNSYMWTVVMDVQKIAFFFFTSSENFPIPLWNYNITSLGERQSFIFNFSFTFFIFYYIFLKKWSYITFKTTFHENAINSGKFSSMPLHFCVLVSWVFFFFLLIKFQRLIISLRCFIYLNTISIKKLKKKKQTI